MALTSLMAPVLGWVTDTFTRTEPAAITCRPQLRNALQPILDNSAGQLLGVASPLAATIGVIAGVALIALAGSRYAGRIMRWLLGALAGVVIVFTIPDIIAAFGGSC